MDINQSKGLPIKLKPITPETIVNGGMTVTLTHECEEISVSPIHGSKRTTRKGYKDAQGEFVDYGDTVTEFLSASELAELLDEKGGDCKLSDVTAKIQTVKNAKEAEQRERTRKEQEKAAKD